MRISCVQMDVLLGKPEENLARVKELTAAAAQEGADVVVLPETWNVGFFPKEGLAVMADPDGVNIRRELGSLAKSLHVNLVAGSAATLRDGKVFNTSYVFDREGGCVGRYDKTHLFSPMGEHEYFTPGADLCAFSLDGVRCGLILCYDIRFPELTRSLALDGIDMLFVPAQWPNVRAEHWRTLTKARAIENQIFLACCNGCGTAGDTVYGGNSAIYDPWGVVLAAAGEKEETISADCDLSVIDNIRSRMHVFNDRRPELYHY